MAIDTAAKRKSAVAISLYALGPVLVPDGTIGDADRQAVGYGYFGIDAISITVPATRKLYAGVKPSLALRNKPAPVVGVKPSLKVRRVS